MVNQPVATPCSYLNLHTYSHWFSTLKFLQKLTDSVNVINELKLQGSNPKIWQYNHVDIIVLKKNSITDSWDLYYEMSFNG